MPSFQAFYKLKKQQTTGDQTEEDENGLKATLDDMSNGAADEMDAKTVTGINEATSKAVLAEGEGTKGMHLSFVPSEISLIVS